MPSVTDYVGVEVHRGRVRSEWIDVNAHMNVAYYVLAFDYGVDGTWEAIGMTDARRDATNSSTFAVECHVTWQREIAVDEPYVVTTEILAYDTKRVHQFMRMYHGERHELCATCEWLNLHVDLGIRRVTPWPDDVLALLAEFVARQGETRWPDEAGKRMHVREPLFAVAETPS